MRTVSIKLYDVHACIGRVHREWRERQRLSVPCRQFQRDGDSVVTEFNPICISARPMQSPVANAPYSLAVDSVRNRRCAALLERLNCHSWQGFRGYVPKCEQIGYALLNIVPKQQQKVVLTTQLTNENNSISRKSGDLNYFWYTESWRNCTLVLCSMSTTAEKMSPLYLVKSRSHVSDQISIGFLKNRMHQK